MPIYIIQLMNEYIHKYKKSEIYYSLKFGCINLHKRLDREKIHNWVFMYVPKFFLKRSVQFLLFIL